MGFFSDLVANNESDIRTATDAAFGQFAAFGQLNKAELGAALQVFYRMARAWRACASASASVALAVVGVAGGRACCRHLGSDFFLCRRMCTASCRAEGGRQLKPG